MKNKGWRLPYALILEDNTKIVSHLKSFLLI